MSRAEYFRLLGIDCSPELRRRIDVAFRISEHPTEEEYVYIAPSSDGNCRMMDENHLCMIHRECGEEFQPAVCRLYPRAIKTENPAAAVCSGSCEKVIEMLMEEPYPLPFTIRSLHTTSAAPADIATDSFTMRRRCMDLWQEDGSDRERFEALAALLGGTDDGFRVDSTVGFLTYARDLLEFFARGDITLCDIADEALERFRMTEGVSEASVKAFTEANARLAEAIPHLEHHYGNIMANHMLYASFPYVTDTDNYPGAFRGFAAVYVLLRFLCACAVFGDNVRDSFVDITATVMRYVEHTDFYGHALTVHTALRKRK